MLVSVTSEGGIPSDGEIPRTWVIEEPSDNEKGRKGEPDKRSPVTLGADTLRLARHRGRPLRAVRRRLDLPRHRSIGEVLHHANAQPRAARRLLRQPGPRVSSNGAGETGALPEAIEGVVGVALAVGVPAEQIDLADRSHVQPCQPRPGLQLRRAGLRRTECHPRHSTSTLMISMWNGGKVRLNVVRNQRLSRLPCRISRDLMANVSSTVGGERDNSRSILSLAGTSY